MNPIRAIRKSRINAWSWAGLLLFGLASACSASTVIGPTGGAQLNITNWGADNGAPASGVWAVVQTNDGYLWMTAAGNPELYRFDGRRFEHIELPKSDRVASPRIFTLFAPKSGGLWLGFTVAGAAFLKDGHMTVYTERDGVPPGSVKDFAEEEDGTLWALTTGGLTRFVQGHWQPMATGIPRLDPHHGALLLDTEGRLWLTGIGELYTLERGESTFHRVNVRITGRPELAESRAGVIWLQDDSDELRPIRKVANPSGRPVSSVQSLLMDQDDNIWLSGPNVLARVSLSRETTDPHSIRWRNRNEPLTEENIIGWHANGDGSGFLQDREGNVWITSRQGIARIFQQNLTHEVDTDVAVAMTTGSDGEVWLYAHYEEPIFNLKNAKVIPLPGGKHVSSALTSDDHSLWFGGAGGLVHYQDGKSVQIDLPPDSQGLEVQAMAQEHSGALWVSVTHMGLLRFNKGKWTKKGGFATLPDSPALAAATDHSGNIWLGYPHNQIAAVSSGVARAYSETDGLTVGNVTAIYGKRTKLWVGGELGLAFFDGEKFHAVRPQPPMQIGGISGIIETPEGDLWLNGSSGIVHIERKELRHLTEQPTEAVRGEVFDSADGLQGLGDYPLPVPSVIEAQDSRLWFATSLGVFSVDPNGIRRNPLAPPVHISALYVGERAFSPTEGIKLPERTTALRIDYVGLSLTMPEKVRYRYKLDEQNTEWQEAHSEQANFVDLHPGEYHFHVIASNNDGVWNPAGATLKFVIPPAFTQTRSFLALCIIAIAVVSWLLFTLRMRQVTARIRLRLNERLRERERIARELHDTLLQSTQGLMLRVQAARNQISPNDPARTVLDTALKRADEVLAEARDRVQDLRIPAEARADLAKSLRAVGEELALGRNVAFKVGVEGITRALRAKIVDDVYSIGREAIANAFHHAQASEINLTIDYGIRDLRISVIDDGCGIDPDILDHAGRPGHWGLKGMRERTNEIGAHLKIQSRPGGGTVIELAVPLAFAPTKRSFPFRGPRFLRERGDTP